MLREVPRLLLRLPRLRRRPRAEGAPVLAIPGFGASDASLWALRRYLRSLGYRVRGWGLGRNNGNVPELIPKVVERAARLALDARAPVRLVGWSLGGNLAREAARERPEAVERIVTLGTPVVGGPKYTLAAGYFRQQGFDLDHFSHFFSGFAGIRAPGFQPQRFDSGLGASLSYSLNVFARVPLTLRLEGALLRRDDFPGEDADQLGVEVETFLDAWFKTDVFLRLGYGLYSSRPDEDGDFRSRVILSRRF